MGNQAARLFIRAIRVICGFPSKFGLKSKTRSQAPRLRVKLDNEGGLTRPYQIYFVSSASFGEMASAQIW